MDWISLAINGSIFLSEKNEETAEPPYAITKLSPETPTAGNLPLFLFTKFFDIFLSPIFLLGHPTPLFIALGPPQTLGIPSLLSLHISLFLFLLLKLQILATTELPTSLFLFFYFF